jgi:hypothetical protein
MLITWKWGNSGLLAAKSNRIRLLLSGPLLIGALSGALSPVSIARADCGSVDPGTRQLQQSIESHLSAVRGCSDPAEVERRLRAMGLPRILQAANAQLLFGIEGNLLRRWDRASSGYARDWQAFEAKWSARFPEESDYYRGASRQWREAGISEPPNFIAGPKVLDLVATAGALSLLERPDVKRRAAGRCGLSAESIRARMQAERDNLIWSDLELEINPGLVQEAAGILGWSSGRATDPKPGFRYLAAAISRDRANGPEDRPEDRMIALICARPEQADEERRKFVVSMRDHVGARRVAKSRLRLFELHFRVVQDSVLRVLDHRFARGNSDPDGLLHENYILREFIALMPELKLAGNAGVNRDLQCLMRQNEAREERLRRREELVIGGGFLVSMLAGAGRAAPAIARAGMAEFLAYTSLGAGTLSSLTADYGAQRQLAAARREAILAQNPGDDESGISVQRRAEYAARLGQVRLTREAADVARTMTVVTVPALALGELTRAVGAARGQALASGDGARALSLGQTLRSLEMADLGFDLASMGAAAAQGDGLGFAAIAAGRIGRGYRAPRFRLP